MASSLNAITFAANDPAALCEFWARMLQRPAGDLVVLPTGPLELPLRFIRTDEPKLWPNRFHFDLTSGSIADQNVIVERALQLGAPHHDVGQLPEEPHVVLADPEGNEFCVIEPGNNFLAGTGTIGALAGDGSEAVGRFWSAALGWPLVWDQDEETAIQAPEGGSKFTWGGPPVEPKHEPMRIGFELALNEPAEVEAEVARLLSLGAGDRGPGSSRSRLLVDPDDNEFTLTWNNAPSSR